MSELKRQIRIVVADDSNDAHLELPGSKSASDMMKQIRKDGGVWIEDRHIPYHAITQVWYEEY